MDRVGAARTGGGGVGAVNDAATCDDDRCGAGEIGRGGGRRRRRFKANTDAAVSRYSREVIGVACLISADDAGAVLPGERDEVAVDASAGANQWGQAAKGHDVAGCAAGGGDGKWGGGGKQAGGDRAENNRLRALVDDDAGGDLARGGVVGIARSRIRKPRKKSSIPIKSLP